MISYCIGFAVTGLTLSLSYYLMNKSGTPKREHQLCKECMEREERLRQEWADKTDKLSEQMTRMQETQNQVNFRLRQRLDNLESQVTSYEAQFDVALKQWRKKRREIESELSNLHLNLGQLWQIAQERHQKNG